MSTQTLIDVYLRPSQFEVTLSPSEYKHIVRASTKLFSADSVWNRLVSEKQLQAGALSKSCAL